jgi:GNAT superfamily N-acetyltransferase
MYISSTYRGKNLAVLLQRSLHQTLKDEGYVKVYGAYYEDNLPALWMHRMLKFKEHPRRKVFRFFFYVRSALLTSANAPLSLANTTQKGD